AEVVVLQERALTDGRVGAEPEDQRGHQRERKPGAGPAPRDRLQDRRKVHAGVASPAPTRLARPPEPTIASTMRRSSSSSPGISSTIRPRESTTTRSQSPASSSGSLDLRTIATPSRAFARSAS